MWGQHPFTLTTADDITNGTQKYYLIQSIDRPTFYAIPHSNAEGSKVSTTSIPNANMRWCFVDAGSDSDHQYYYIVNSTGKCLYRNNDSNDGILIKKAYANLSSLSDDELTKYKFFLTQTGSDYFIQPKGFPGKYLNKRGGNTNYANGYYIKSSDYNDSPSVWNFVAVGSVTWPQPFTVSTNAERHNYKFKNVTNTTFYLSNSGEWATVSSVGSDEDIWYFLEAGVDATYSNCHYYYIVNAATSKYLYHTGGTGDDVAKVMDYNSAEDDKYRFFIVDAAYKPNNSNYATGYSIVPQLRQTYFNDKNSYAPMAMSDNSHLLLKSNRATTGYDADWTFEAVWGDPVVTCDETGTITITGEDDAEFYYTKNNSTTPPATPIATESETNFKYNPLNKPTAGTGFTTIKVRAIKAGKSDSRVITQKIVYLPSQTFESTYDGTTQVPVVEVGGTPISSEEFNISYKKGGVDVTECKDAGTYTVEITDKDGGEYIVYGSGSFTINKKTLSITAEAKSKTYGDDDPALTYASEGLVGSDAITGALSRAEGETVGTYAISQGTLTAGDNYEISYTGENLTIAQKALTITADSDTKEYNGEPLTKNSYTHTDLATGDVIISVTVTGSQTDRGESDNVPSAAVIKNNNGNGDDVTACYDITYVNGRLWVTGRLITITAASDEKVYDGTPLTKNSYTYEGMLYSGDEIKSVTVTGSQTVAGSSNNVPSAAVIKNGETDKTANYDFTYVNGTLTVTQKALTITANSDSKVYNSTALTNDGYTNTTLASGDAITSVTVTGSQTDVGTGDNVPSGAVIKNGSNDDVTSSYNITYTKGTLSVTAKAVTITAKDASKTYDRTPLTEGGFTATALETDDTHSFTVVMTTGSTITDAGTQPNVIATVDGVAVTTGIGTAVGNYVVTTANGTLTITGAPVTVTAGNKSKGFGDADPELTWTASGLIDPDTEEVLTVGISRAEGEDVGGYTITPSGDAEQGNYTVTYVPGTLTITAKAIGNGTVPAEGIDIDITFDGTDYSVTVKQGDNTLATTNYILSGADDPEHPENYVVTVTGQGNYNNLAKATYTKQYFYDTTPDAVSTPETWAAVYYATQNLQVSNEFDAYYVTNLENNTLTIQKIEVGAKSYIPENQPVILLSKPDATSKPWGFTLKPYAGTTTTITDNILCRSTGGETVDWAQYYIFSFGEFVLSMGNKTMATGKFYLENPSYNTSANARQVLRIMRRGTTNIDNDEINDNDSQSKDSWYTIDGRRLSSKPTKKGLYIRRPDGGKNGSVTVIK